MDEKNRHLEILKKEKVETEKILRNQISSVRYALDRIELKLGRNTPLYVSDGLQGASNDIDVLVARLATYDRAIELFNRQLSKGDE